MVRIYRRHIKSCPHTSERERRCKCPIHCEGSIGEERVKPQSLNLTSWEAATKKVREWESAGTTKTAERITLTAAIASYEADCEARKLSLATRKKISVLLARLAEFAVHRNIVFLSAFGVSDVREFRATWDTWGTLTQIKNIERLKTFFRFAVQSKWIVDSPASFVKPPETPKTHIKPFTDAELSKIHATIVRPIMRAFVYVLEFTGLRISDAVQLQVSDIVDGKLRIRTEKTDEHVWLPLPPFLLKELASISTTQYYFWTGESKLSTVIGSKRRGLAKLLARAGVEGNPHKFRHTLATSLLAKGTSPAIVAKILGNSEKIVLKHYDHWIPERQSQLEREIQKTWTPPRGLDQVAAAGG